MKFIRFEYNGQEELGIFNLEESKVISISSILDGKNFNDMNNLIEMISQDEINKLKEVYKSNDVTKAIDIEEVQLLSPIERPIHDIICVGLNYADHIGEVRGAGDDLKDNDNIVYFSKRASKILGSGEKLLSLQSNQHSPRQCTKNFPRNA